MDIATQQKLLEVSNLDRDITLLTNERQEIEQTRNARADQIRRDRERLKELEGRHAAALQKQSEAEQKLRDEEKRIVERRKQLSALGGAKAAKNAEREVDIATRAIQTMEEQTLRAMQDAESAGNEVSAVRDSLTQLESSFESDAVQFESRIGALNEKLLSLQERRTADAEALDASLLRLYERVHTRYPVGAVSKVENGSCTGCFRSLPAQLVNQILAASSVFQCPGCSRILVCYPEQQ